MQDINKEDIFWHDYQTKARSTAIYPRQGKNPLYPMLGLIGEIGEIANKVKKIMRDDNDQITEKHRSEIGDEIGDVLWYVANLCYELSINMHILEIDVPKKESCTDVWTFLYGAILNMHQVASNLGSYTFFISRDTAFLKKQIPKSHNLLVNDLNEILIQLHDIIQILELDLRKIATQNIEKLFDRKDRGVLGGSGDGR